jgi:TolB protein
VNSGGYKVHIRETLIFYAVALVVSLGLIAGCAQAVPTPTPVQPTASLVPSAATPTVPTWKTYSSAVFGISLEYPANWQKKQGDDERYEGSDGFFQINVVSGEGWTIDEVARSVAYEKIQPYASSPLIESLQIQGQEARLILPAGDYVKDAEGQAWLVVHAPQPIRIGGQEHNHLVLRADQDHIGEIVKTLRFVSTQDI